MHGTGIEGGRYGASGNDDHDDIAIGVDLIV